jgi:hypothetical protein
MTHVDAVGSVELQRITVAAVARAASRGLFTAAEAGLLIDRILVPTTTSPLTTQDSNWSGVGGYPRDERRPVLEDSSMSP